MNWSIPPPSAPKPAPTKKQAAPSRAHLICVVGAPGVGKSTVCTIFSQASQSSLQVLPDAQSSGIGALLPRIEQAIDGGNTVLLDGAPTSADDLQLLVDEGFLDAAKGAVVRLWTDDELLQLRRRQAGRPVLAEDELKTFYDFVSALEEKCRQHDLHYCVVTNGDPLHCVVELARIAGVKD